MQLTKKKVATVAAAMSLTAALTGGTLALWNDSANLTFADQGAAQIQSGELSLALLGNDVEFAAIRDHSEYRVVDGELVAGDPDTGYDITELWNGEGFYFSPQDKIHIDLAVDGQTEDLFTLVGTNLVADLNFEIDPVVVDAEVAEALRGFNFDLLVNGESATGEPIRLSDDTGVTFTLEVTFDAADQEHFLVDGSVLLAEGVNLNATLQQVREIA